MCCSVRSRNCLTTLFIDSCQAMIANLHSAAYYTTTVNEYTWHRNLYIFNFNDSSTCQGNSSTVSQLAAAFGIKGSSIKNNLNIITSHCMSGADSIDQDCAHDGFRSQMLVSNKFSTTKTIGNFSVLSEIGMTAFLRSRIGLSSISLFFHETPKAICIYF
ncbi:unannotated protein [freshwater metagenome]|uniref:Unannotated protein n=1 Tax=freshwater metagenome TaxID=449393 RepID=A0A6J6VW12_9ZZZZ